MTVILVFGLVRYFMEENGYPVAPAILGMIHGTMLEENFISSMIKSDGCLMGFFERPIAAGLGALTLIIWLSPLLIWRRRAVATTRA